MAAEIDYFLLYQQIQAYSILSGGLKMKKIAIELFIIAATVMAYVLPVLADGGGN